MSSVTITITDESTSGVVTNKLEVSFASELTTVKDIIEARVSTEVASYNNKLPAYFNGLIKPNDAEQTLNGYKLKHQRKVDVEKQIYSALDAFNKNGYFVLIDNIQAESLEQMVVINDKTTVSFVKLTPLVGG
ncbi:MAG: hypothetical protein ACOVO1_10020 [Chitinophagaceae bacterium]